MTGMVGIEVIASELMWGIRNKDHTGAFNSEAYKVNTNWHGINLRYRTKKRQHALEKIGQNIDKSSTKKKVQS